MGIRQYLDEGMRVEKGERKYYPRKSEAETFLETAENDAKIDFVVNWLPTIKVFSSKGEFEIVVRTLEAGMGFLRTLCAENKIDGLEYKRLDDKLRALGARAEAIWKVTRWMWMQDMRASKGKRYADTGDKTRWDHVSEEAARKASREGKMTRTSGEGNKRIWEVAR